MNSEFDFLRDGSEIVYEFLHVSLYIGIKEKTFSATINLDEYIPRSQYAKGRSIDVVFLQ